MAITSGSWSIGGVKLPEFGISEKISNAFGQGRTASGGSNLFGNQTQTVQVPSSSGGFVPSGSAGAYGVQGGNYLQPKTTTNGGTGGLGGSQGQILGASSPDSSSGIISPTQNMGGSGSEIDAINQQFNQFGQYLDSQASNANQNFTETKGLYDTSKANAEKQYQGEKQAQAESYSKQGSLNLGKVRQLLSDLNQRQAAQIGITGGGSVSEALGERFGRSAQQNLGSVMDQTQTAIQRTNDFYNTALTKLQESYDTNVSQARQTLNDNLGQISLARTQSAAAKQNATMDAWRSYYSNVNQAKIQAAQFKANYDLWKSQQDNQLAATQGQNSSIQSAYNDGVSRPTSNITSPGVTNTNQGQQTYNPYYNQFATDQNKKDQVPQYGSMA